MGAMLFCLGVRHRAHGALLRELSIHGAELARLLRPPRQPSKLDSTGGGYIR